MSMVVLIMCATILALLVSGSVQVVKDARYRDNRPYYWDESRDDLTEMQQQVILAHESNRRMKRIILEIEAQRTQNNGTDR